ncbi:ATP-binding protein [Bradyrhizobium sp. NAS80.1]|uniref:ATP-binding protein n=1 Tax=Bradyrhizobium sp. NAS80.1 TaxID=1680159 RepID=UPI00143D687B|nr:ATP-binding protein [Bradyrhizobium sp. NAS80.1]
MHRLFFFAYPIFSFEIENTRDVLTCITFLFASLFVTGLVRHLRDLATAHHEQTGLLDLTHDAVFVRSLDGVIAYWNRGSEKLYGWGRDEAVGKIEHELLRTQFPAPLDEIRRLVLATGHWEGELHHMRRDGTPIFVASRWSLQKGRYGEPLGILEINSDTTERKRAEEALRRIQAAYFAEAQSLSMTGSFGWNVTSSDIFWSEETYHIFGYEVTLKPSIASVMERVHPDDVALVTSTIERTATQKSDVDIEHRLLMPDGTIKTVHLRARPLTEWIAGKPDETVSTQFVGAVMDVTAQTKAYAALQESQAELAHAARLSVLGELAASIAHELNHPLAALAMNGDAGLRWLDRAEPNIAEASEAMRRVVADARRAGEMIARIRGLASRRSPQRASLALNEVIVEALQCVHYELQSTQIEVLLDLAPRPLTVLADKVQLLQVIINLIINGAQAMATVDDRPRQVVIRSRENETGQALVSVQDSGVGINPEHADRLFEAFFTTKSSGMGLGLSICRTIVEGNGGRIWMSNNSRRGATFQFSLPALRHS